MDRTQIEKAVQDGIAAGIEPMKRELDDAKKKIAELEKAPATDNARSLVGLVANERAAKIDTRKAAEETRQRMRIAGADALINGEIPDAMVGRRIGRWLRGVMLARSMEALGERVELPELFERVLGDRSMADIADVHIRTMQAGQFGSGGAFLPDIFAAEFIEFLRPVNVVLSLMPRIIPLMGGNLILPKVTNGATAGYEGENVAPAPTEQSSGQLRLSAKRSVAITPQSNTLLRRGGALVEQMIADDLRAAMAGLFDQTALRGSGTQYAPAGLKSLMDSTFVETAYNSTTPSAAQVEADLYTIIGNPQDADNLLQSPGFIFSYRIERYLKQLRTANGEKYFPELDQGKLLGYPYRATNHVPNNLGGGSNESEIYFGSFSELLVGLEEELATEVFPNGAYTNSSGTVISGISTDVTVVRMQSSHDFALRHAKAFSMLSAVKWGG